MVSKLKNLCSIELRSLGLLESSWSEEVALIAIEREARLHSFLYIHFNPTVTLSVLYTQCIGNYLATEKAWLICCKHG